MQPIEQNWTCSKCGADLNNAVAVLGKDAFWYHQFIHDAESKELEIRRLRKGIEELRDGGYGVKEEAQELLTPNLALNSDASQKAAGAGGCQPTQECYPIDSDRCDKCTGH